MNKVKSVITVSLVFLAIEVLYYNILYDILLVAFLLLTSLAIGTYVPIKRIKFLDRILLQVAAGLGIAGFAIWLTIFYNFNYRSLYLAASVVVIASRYRQLTTIARHLRRFAAHIHRANPAIFVILLIAQIFYIIAASYPVWQYDTLTKHIAIPFKILNQSHWDYNVIEFVGYGDYAILPHMFFLYLMALGGTKALALFSVALSSLILMQLLRIGRSLSKSTIMPLLISAVYLTTPLIHFLSTTLYVDLYPVYFILAALLVLKYLDDSVIVPNTYLVSFLCGTAIFGKQHGITFIGPIAVVVLFFFVRACLNRRYRAAHLSVKLMLAFSLFILPFLPSLLIVWHKTGNPLFPFMNGVFKSEYYDTSNFDDPYYHSPLGLNFQSIVKMVFHTNNNTEMAAGGLGLYLLGLFLLPIIVILNRKDELFLTIVFLMLSTYALSTSGANYNIRYKVGPLALAIVVVCYTVTYFIDLFKTKTLQKLTGGLIGASLVCFNIVYLVLPSNMWSYKREMLAPNDAFVSNANQSVLYSVNKQDVKVLSNNDVLRGTFKGHFYTLNWYNTYLIQFLERGAVSPAGYLRSFDYYLIDKRAPLNFQEYFSVDKSEISSLLSPFAESDTHILYKINRAGIGKTILSGVFARPLLVNVEKPEARVFRAEYGGYSIQLDVGKPATNASSMGRFQINWLDAGGKYVGCSLIPFEINKARSVYQSPIISDVPANAHDGIFYLNSHDKHNVEIFSFKLLGWNTNDFLQGRLQTYDKKWPHLAS